jgi:hypothetical protein
MRCTGARSAGDRWDCRREWLGASGGCGHMLGTRMRASSAGSNRSTDVNWRSAVPPEHIAGSRLSTSSGMPSVAARSVRVPHMTPPPAGSTSTSDVDRGDLMIGFAALAVSRGPRRPQDLQDPQDPQDRTDRSTALPRGPRRRTPLTAEPIPRSTPPDTADRRTNPQMHAARHR